MSLVYAREPQHFCALLSSCFPDIGKKSEITNLAGMGRYKLVRHALDILLHQDALETMLQRLPAAIDSHGVAGRRHFPVYGQSNFLF